MTLLFLETIGTTELLFILVVALVVFGPRRLPELGRKIGKGMAEFRRASDDFKRTWEREVELERTTEHTRLSEAAPVAAGGALPAREEGAGAAGPVVFESENSIARGRHAPYDESAGAQPHPDPTQPDADAPAAARQEQLGKADWL